ncbi:MAG: Nif3-like dinuclear metal center hexameric protein [bacterium]|nr:MAG: Nif3-like dinuclear metal center hexameric protein [bacterium]
MLTVTRIAEEIERIAPPDIALPDDTIGLQVGSPDWRVERIMMAVDADYGTARQAAESGAGLLLTHHPLIHKPLQRVDLQTETGRAIDLCLKKRIAVYSAHTNLDAASQGMNAALAEAVGLSGGDVLLPTNPDRVKVVTFVPLDSLEDVREALFRSGGGRIGAYSRCSFTTPGEGTFLGGQGTKPQAGVPGRFERVHEVRLEVVFRRADLPLAVASLLASHPYEEPVVDVYSMVCPGGGAGIGLIGDLPGEVSVKSLVPRILEPLRGRCARLIGDPEASVTRVALCAGSGGSLMKAAIERGAGLYVTGDMKYHDARLAQHAGLTVLDVGHFGPERLGIERFGELLRSTLAETGHRIEVLFAEEEDPFREIERDMTLSEL